MADTARVPDKYDWAQDERPTATFSVGAGGFVRWTWPYWFLMACALGLACIGFFVPAKEGPVVAYTMGAIGVLAAAGCVAWAIYAWSQVIGHVRLYADGVLWVEKGRWRGARWEEIDEFYRTEIIVNGSTQTKEVVVKTAGGLNGRFTHALPRWGKLAEALQMQTTMAQGPAAQAKFRAGEVVAFGPVKVSLRGLKMNGQSLAWEEVRRIEIGNGFLMVYSAGKRKDPNAVSLGEVPNYLVLLKILEHTPGPAPTLTK